MKIRVKKEFRDKYTKIIYKTGDVLDMAIWRINEVIAAGSFIELLEQPKPTEAKETEQIEQTEQGRAASRRKRTK